MKTKPALAAAGALLTLALAPSAFAHDFCVADPSCVATGGTDEATVAAALTAADKTVDLDRVLIGPGTYVAPTTAGFQAVNPVELIGAGSAATTLTGPVDTTTVATLDASGSRAADLAIKIPANATNTSKSGLMLRGSLAEHVKVTVDPALSTAASGIYPKQGSIVQDSEVYMPWSNASVYGILAQAGTTLRRSIVSGKTPVGIQGPHVRLDRDLIVAGSLGVMVVNSATDIEMTNSIVRTTGSATGVDATTMNGMDAGIALRGDTIVGDNTPGSYGVWAGSSTAHAATVTVDSSIIRGAETPVSAGAYVAGATASLSIQYSDFDPAAAISDGAATVTFGAGNVNSDPSFAGVSDFNLLAGSPAIDSGNPADLGDISDYDGRARVTDGNGDGIAQRDMGAQETAAGPGPAADPIGPGGSPADPVPPATAASQDKLTDTTVPVITGLRARRGPRLTFKLSEHALVRVAIARRSQTTRLRKLGTLSKAFGPGPATLKVGRIGRSALKPGSYVATVTAVDGARNRSRAYTVRFKVARA